MKKNYCPQLKGLIDDYCSELETSDISKFCNYKFSKEYLKRKRTLIAKRKKFYYSFIKTTSRKIVSIIIAAAIIGSMSVMAYEPVRNFIVHLFSGYSTVEPDSDDSKGCHKKTIEKEFDIDIPNGFTLSQNESVFTKTFVSKVYITDDDQEYLYFSQYTQDCYKSNVDNEQGQLIQKYDKNGNEILVHNINDNNVTIIWDSGEYIFELSGTFSENKLMEIYYSVK